MCQKFMYPVVIACVLLLFVACPNAVDTSASSSNTVGSGAIISTELENLRIGYFYLEYEDGLPVECARYWYKDVAEAQSFEHAISLAEFKQFSTGNFCIGGYTKDPLAQFSVDSASYAWANPLESGRCCDFWKVKAQEAVLRTAVKVKGKGNNQSTYPIIITLLESRSTDIEDMYIHFYEKEDDYSSMPILDKLRKNQKISISASKNQEHPYFAISVLLSDKNAFPLLNSKRADHYVYDSLIKQWYAVWYCIDKSQDIEIDIYSCAFEEEVQTSTMTISIEVTN